MCPDHGLLRYYVHDAMLTCTFEVVEFLLGLACGCKNCGIIGYHHSIATVQSTLRLVVEKLALGVDGKTASALRIIDYSLA